MGKRVSAESRVMGVSPALVALVVGFALFTCSSWASRSDAAVLSTEALYLSRFVKVGHLPCGRYLFRSHIPQVPPFFLVSLGLW